MFYAVVDCDNCFVSCERVYRPDLNGKPVVVLSNNDGCVVSRSNEAKKLGIKMGTPYFQMREHFSEDVVTAFSSNYELYSNLTAGVMDIIKDAAPEYFRYSIDEAFCILSGMDHFDLRKWGLDLRNKILESTGLPVSIGIARTKTLAKMASHYAKKYKGYQHCCMIDSDEKCERALRLYPVEEVWGIGRRYFARLKNMDIKTAYDFASHTRSWVRMTFNVMAERTWMELHGIDCVPNDDMKSRHKTICCSRSFATMTDNKDTLRAYIANFASYCAKKLRGEGSVAATVEVFLYTNRYRTDLAQYYPCKEIKLLTPTNLTIPIVHAAGECLDMIYREHYLFKKAGVILGNITSNAGIQTNFLDDDIDKQFRMKRLDDVVDSINQKIGRDLVTLGAQQYETHDGKVWTSGIADIANHRLKSKITNIL